MNPKDRAIELYYRFFCKKAECATLFDNNFIEDAIDYIDELILFFDTFGDKEEIEYYNKVKIELKKLDII